MKKHLLLFWAFNAILLTASPVFAADPFGTPGPAPAAVNIYDWYNLGEHVTAATKFNFNESIYQQMDDTYKQVYELMVKANSSEGTLNAFKQWYRVLKALPWDKDWSVWPKEQQNNWNNSPLEGAWTKAVQTDAQRAKESEFFYWIGRHTLDLAWEVPYYQSQGYTKNANDLIASAAGDFIYFSTDPGYSPIFTALTPEVQNAMTFIMAAKKKLSGATDPFDTSSQAGLTADDVSKIVDAAKQIRAAAQAKQFTK
jgi:hypothetical protein